MITMLGWGGYPQTRGNFPMASIRKEFEGTEIPSLQFFSVTQASAMKKASLLTPPGPTDTSKSPKVSPHMWQMRSRALTEPLLNQLITGGEAVIR